MILHARGFIRKDQTNFELFNQLYWLISITFCSLAIIPNLVLNFTGKFPMGSVRGQVCLLLPLNSEPQKKGENIVVKGLLFSFGFNAIAYVFYLGSRSKRLIKIMCPGSKMSCIGLYKRNVLDYRETAVLSVAWAVMNMFYAVNIELYKYLDLSPKAAFFIDTFYYIFVFEIITISIIFALSSRDFPVHTPPCQVQQFYVTFPSVLVPRVPPQSQVPLPAPLLNPNTVTATYEGNGKGNGKNRKWSQPTYTTLTNNHTSSYHFRGSALTVVD